MKERYICPMHPEVTQEKPGRCPKCGMRLVLESKLDLSPINHSSGTKAKWTDYLPLIVVIGLITLITTALSIKDFYLNQFLIQKTISYFTIGFFLTFSGFKLIDLKGFAEGYSTYDLLAQRWFNYGYIYPFIELFFGLATILIGDPKWLLIVEIVIMTFSGIGVAIKLLKREKFQCACLGTFLKVPLTKITLIEDFGMALLALILLLSK